MKVKEGTFLIVPEGTNFKTISTLRQGQENLPEAAREITHATDDTTRKKVTEIRRTVGKCIKARHGVVTLFHDA